MTAARFSRRARVVLACCAVEILATPATSHDGRWFPDAIESGSSLFETQQRRSHEHTAEENRTVVDVRAHVEARTAHVHAGVGIIADATTKLLYAYPEPLRGEIIDWFFKRNWGASLDILKVSCAAALLPWPSRRRM